MAGIAVRTWTGPKTYTVAAVIAAGQLVIPDGTSNLLVNVAGAGAINVLGVALEDAAPAGTDAVTDVAARQPYAQVAYNCEVPVTYAVACNCGDRLKAAATGQVTKWVTDTDAVNLIVGVCTTPGGVGAGAVGLARIAPVGM